MFKGFKSTSWDDREIVTSFIKVTSFPVQQDIIFVNIGFFVKIDLLR